MLERLVARLVADETLLRHLVFKDGFVGLRVYDCSDIPWTLSHFLLKLMSDQHWNGRERKRKPIWTTGFGFDLRTRSILQLKVNTAALGRFTILTSSLTELVDKRAVDEQVDVRENVIDVRIFSLDQRFDCVTRIDRDMETVAL